MRIIIEGNIGSGKTTLSKMLAEEIGCEYIPEQFEKISLLDEFYRGKPVALELELAFLRERLRQFRNLNSCTHFIADHSFYRSAIFAEVNLNPKEFLIFQEEYQIYLSQIKPPDVLIYLASDIENLIENIKNRGRESELTISTDYLKALNLSYCQFFDTYDLSKVIKQTNFMANYEDITTISQKLKSL